MQISGKVYLVGAGIGDFAYLTLRGQHLLTNAEVVIYDALVAPRLLALVPSNCLKLDVGKRGGKESTSQAKINQLLVAYCQQGKQIVRLKSGDPFIFGRAREEIEALSAAGCQWEIVPGISSALAAPLLAGIPLTDKYLSSCFAVLSGHQPELLDWEALAKIDTLVILMGSRSLPTIIANLLAHGRVAIEPVAIICNSSRWEQKIFRGTLADIVDRTRGISLSPAVIVIGKVVDLANQLQPSPSSLPLTDKTILVTRAVEQSSQFSNLLQQQGAKVLEMPALEITPPSSWQALDNALSHLIQFNWLILTSANAVEYFFNRLTTLGKDARSLAGIKIAVVGTKTAASLRKQNLQPDFIPPDFVADSLVAHFPEKLTGQTILFPRVETGGREVLIKQLTAQGARIIEVPAYQSKCPEKIDLEIWQALQKRQIDVITFASSKTVRNFVHLVQQKLEPNLKQTFKDLLTNIVIASIGPQTSQTCQELFNRVDLEAEEYTLEGLTNAIVKYIAIEA
jgi:uroporphyrinogen III methyltransferase/synthase